TVDDDDEDLITDAITGKPYRALSDHLLSLWMRAGPGRGVELPVDSYKESVLAAVRDGLRENHTDPTLPAGGASQERRGGQLQHPGHAASPDQRR
ncbi:hypothetical protein M9458_003136, partial [Cirrhinus mrigala]